jgi:hypothetical protein
MKKFSNYIVVIMVLLIVNFIVKANAQGYHNPKAGTSERKAILDTVRKRVEHDISQTVVFKVEFLRSQDGWALLEAIPMTSSNRPINWSRTKYADDYRNGAFGGGVDALLRYKSGHWRVVAYVLGASDVTYVDWPKQYGCPKAICHLGGGN